MARLQGKTAVVTGASSGIGAALVREFIAAGMNVVGTARREDRLRVLADKIDPSGTRLLVIAADVTVDGDLRRVADAAVERFGSIDVVVANAGIGIGGPVNRLSLDDYRRQFEVNVFGVLRTVHATHQALVASRGRLAIIGSVNSYLSFPRGSAYSMSKFAARALAESLRAELAPFSVSVTHIAPGFVDTEIRRLDNHGALVEGAVDPAPAWLRMPVEVAARKITKAIARRSRERVLGVHGAVGVLAAKHLAGPVAWFLAHAQRRRALERARRES